MKRTGLFLSLLFIAALPASLSAGVLVMDNFEDGTAGNMFGGGSEGVSNANGGISFVSTITVGNTGFGRGFSYNSISGSLNYFSGRNNVNLSAYRYVSFKIRGETGGENLTVMMDDGSNFPQAKINSFISNAVTKDFQKVVISTQAFYTALISWGATGGAFNLLADNTGGYSGVGKVYIDDIRFGTRASPIMWENFNDGAAPFNYGNDYESFISPAGSILTPTYSSSLFYGSTGYSYAVAYDHNGNTTDSVILIPSTSTGLDTAGTDRLSFQIAGNGASSGKFVGIGLKDSAGAESVLNISAYLGSGISTTFQEVKIPVSAFTAGVPALDVTHLRYVQIWFQKSASPAITQTSTFTVNLDNIQFVDTSTPTTPTNFFSSGTAINSQSVINSTAFLTVNADAGSTDVTLEEVRFEHDGLSGGASWYIIGVDTDLADGTYGTTWYNMALIQGTSYQIRAIASDVQGNIAMSGPFTVQLATITPAVPTLTGFQVYSTSVTVSLGLNGNAAGTVMTVTTGSFETSSSSISKTTTITLSNLTPNTTYTLNARAGNSALPSSTLVVVTSTATLPAIPTSLAFVTVAETTVTVSWSSSGNPLTPPTSYQVQISSNDFNFSAFSTSITFATQASTFTLARNTTYYFRVSAYGIGGSNSNFSSTVSARTSLQAVPSTPTAFTVSAISTASITFAWTDNSDSETSFSVLNSTLGVLTSTVPNVTSVQVSGYSPNSLVMSSGIIASNSFGASTASIFITSYTLANPPASLRFNTVNANNVSISWSSNTNPSSVIYEISLSTDDFVFASGISTPTPFSSALTSTSASISSLSSGGTYYFRVRARNGDGVVTSFAASITTVTTPSTVVVSTGGTISAGGTTVDAQAGVSVTNTLLTNGTTMQTLLSTKTASAVYGNGLTLQLSVGVLVTVIPTADGLQVTSTQTIPITNSGFVIQAASGTVSVTISADNLTVRMSTDSPQDILTDISSGGAKSLLMILNPPTGEMRILLAPGSLSGNVGLRFKQSSAFAAGAPAFGSFSPAFGAPTLLNGTGIGVDITLDKEIQPVTTVPITLKYTSAVLGSSDPNLLALARFDDSSQKWLIIPSVVDASTLSVTANTNHFSKFQLMLVTPATDIREARVFPNPLKIYKGQTQMTFKNLTPSASIRIYTYAGELVRQLTADALGLCLWDATNRSGDRVASGVYLVLIEAGENKKTLRVAVEK